MDPVRLLKNYHLEDDSYTLDHYLKSGEEERRRIYTETFKRAESLNPILNSYITLLHEQLNPHTRSKGAAGSNGFRGAPFAVKDVIETAGVVTTAGSLILKDYIPDEDAPCVTALKKRGAVVVGKTNTHEFAAGATSINPHYGPVKNPFDIRRISGGSSGGSAAAVASGSSLFALGTDTGGSVRIPAALCGVTGFKPSYSAISTEGVIPFSWSLDHVGIIGRTVADCSKVFEAMRADSGNNGPVDGCGEHAESRFFEIRGMVLGMCRQYLEGCSVYVRKQFESAITKLRQEGAKTVWITLPPRDLTQACRRVILESEAYSYHEQYLTKFGPLYGEDVKKILERGSHYLAADYLDAQRARTRIFREYERAFDECDFLATPTVQIVAPLLGSAGSADTRLKLIANTEAFNLTVQPAISVRITSKSMLPVGLQLSAAYGCDTRLLAAAKSVEAVIKGGNP